jgi:hypothetical protein
MQVTSVHELDDPDFEQRDLDERARSISAFDARHEDRYWERTYWQERYYDPDRDYEDYAPAYCVGYIGFVQYGGDFQDAERSLCANWERIKSDSRLLLEEALPAIRAAWIRMEREQAEPAIGPMTAAAMFRRRVRIPSPAFRSAAAS